MYQGTINWKKVKAAGVDFAFIRCGGTWGRSAFGQYDDSTYSANVSNARSNGVNVGAYYFSLCITEAEAIKEADFAIAKVKAAGLPKGTPIIMDYEFLSDSRLNTAYNKWKKTSLATARQNLTHLANTFLNRVAEEGYTPVFYSYRSLVDWSGRRFNMTAADNKNENLAAFPFWLAQYSKDNSYLDGDGVRMDYWQYTSSGSVSGITGKVDRDFMYYDTQGTGTAAGTKSIRETKITLEATSIKSDGTPKMPKVTVKDGKKTLKENTDYRLSYYNNVANGTATVVIDGLGSYSNSAYKDFALSSDGTAIVQTAAEVEIDPEGLVSMNMWGFSPVLLRELEKGFVPFLEEAMKNDPLKAEYLLPTIVDELLKKEKATVSVLPTPDTWFGLTYAEDKASVSAEFKKMAEEGKYPTPLF